MGCPNCPRQRDPRFESGELVAADQLLSSNTILAERLALAVSPLVRHARTDILAGLSIEDISLLSGAFNLLQDLAKKECGE